MKSRIRPYFFSLALLLALGVFGSGILSFIHNHHSSASACRTTEECFEENLEESFEETVDFNPDLFDLDRRIPLEFELFELPEHSVSSYTFALVCCSFGWDLPLRI
ncbi:MAG: hypothetical protein JXR40_08230 [Pontiellaceae bacterium]|nr:hypothetical protein [Pontiellaceae bacterium]